MKPVILESPFGGHYVEDHKKYLQACIRDCISRGETPYASHQMLTQAYDDATLEEREIGINAGFAMHPIIKQSVVYLDYGKSDGMKRGIANARSLGNSVVYRYLGTPWSVVLPHEFRAEDAIL